MRETKEEADITKREQRNRKMKRNEKRNKN